MSDRRPTAPEKLERTLREACVRRAIARCEPGTKRGARSSVWAKCTKGTVYDLAVAYCVDHQTGAQVRERFKGRLGGLTAKQVDYWLSKIHKAYIDAVEADIDKHRENPELLAARGKLDVLLPLVISDLSLWFSPLLMTTTAADLDAKLVSAVLRFAELVADAHKVQAQAEHHNALTDRIRADLKGKLAKLVQDETREKGLDKGDLEERILKLVDEAMLGKGASK